MKLKHILAATLILSALVCAAFYAKGSFARQTDTEIKATARPTEKAPLWINETKFINETTVANKSKLETGRAPAEVTITPLGRLTLAKNSEGVLTYDPQHIFVELNRGCAILNLEIGKIGTIQTRFDKKVLCSTQGCQVIEMCADREIGGFLLWGAIGAPAAAIIGASAAGSTINTESGQIASASRLSDIVR